ncbi:MAG: antibiotic biosynthesis monooxygenase [Mycobacterium sp.]
MPEKSSATGVVLLHPLPDRGLRPWIDRATDVARSMPGFQTLRMAVTEGDLQPAVAVTFDTAEQLHDCLDSDAWLAALSDGNAVGVLRKSSDLLIVEGHRLPPGTAAFRHQVIETATAEFIDTQTQIAASTAQFPGYTATVLLPPAPDAGINDWTSILAFRTDEQLAAWSSSAERSRRLAQLRTHLRRDFDTLSVDAPFGSILRIDHGRPRVTPTWKTAMIVLLILYPTVMTLSRFLGPVLRDWGTEPWLSMWLSQILSVAVMTYALMPLATRAFTRWLDPVDGAGVRVSVLGAVTVVAVYAVTLWIFAAVDWLHFWTH